MPEREGASADVSAQLDMINEEEARLRRKLGAGAGTLDERWREVTKAIDSSVMARDKQDERIQSIRVSAWKLRMQEIGKVGSWLQEKESTPVRFIHDESGRIAGSTDEAIGMIKARWQAVYQRKYASHAERMRLAKRRAHSIISSLGGPRSDMQFTPPSVDDLERVARKVRSGPGLDGWHEFEISPLPREVLEMYHALARGWDKSGRVPAAFTEMKQNNLPKPGKIEEDGGLPADGTRRVTVESHWWRIWSSAWAASPAVRDFVTQLLPCEVAGTQGGAGAEGVATNIQEAFQRQGFGASHDYSLAFDHCDPHSD